MVYASDSHLRCFSYVTHVVPLLSVTMCQIPFWIYGGFFLEMAVMVLVMQNVHALWVELSILIDTCRRLVGVSSIFSMHLYHVSPFRYLGLKASL